MLDHTNVPEYTFKQAKANASKNALLSDVCISTSAAPTYLPPYYFETKDAQGNTRSFDLIDGGVAANNPVSISITMCCTSSLSLI